MLKNTKESDPGNSCLLGKRIGYLSCVDWCKMKIWGPSFANDHRFQDGNSRALNPARGRLSAELQATGASLPLFLGGPPWEQSYGDKSWPRAPCWGSGSPSPKFPRSACSTGPEAEGLASSLSSSAPCFMEPGSDEEAEMGSGRPPLPGGIPPDPRR